MVSSTLMGERRWVSARRGGMHVLGKVTVPKPVNLPSQRLENQGLDPNVEIVPKGTLSWGSRSSSSAQNAWGPSALSPPTPDTSVGSSSPLAGRPSSGGSITRPSTAGSDKSHEHASSAWRPNSRPSSASGTVATNQTPAVSTRPRSAETRIGSSQLSRFAEPVTETSVAWGGPRIAVNVGTASSKHNEFTLSSGDFPTLGSETNPELHGKRGHSSHGRPISSGGAAAHEEILTPVDKHCVSDDHPVDASAEKGDVNTWRREASSQTGGGTPRFEKWQRDPQQSQPFPTMNMPSHHFDPWNGTPIQRSPDGVWYRGLPPGAPYRPAVPPRGYPLEPFGYYPSQLPYRPVSNSPAGPRPRASPSSCQLKSGDTYCPQIPDSYVPSHPMIPLRPAFYPGAMPYDGYYGPPRMSFCNPNDRDAASVGLAAGPYVRNPNQNSHPDSGNFNIRPRGYGPSSGMAKEQIESTHSRDSCQGPYKVLLKQHDSLGGNDGEETREPSVKSMTQNDWIADCRNGEATDFSQPVVEVSHQELTSDQRKLSSVPAVGNVPDNNSKAKAVDDGLVKKPETAANIAQKPQDHPTIKRSPTLIDKIEGLNTKARISEGRYESKPVSAREDNVKQFKVRNVKDDHSTDECVSVFYNDKASSGSVISQEVMDASKADENLESTKGGKVVPRQVEHQAPSLNSLNVFENREKVHPEIQKRVHGMQGRGRFNNEGEEWKKKGPAFNSSVKVTTANADVCGDALVQDHLTHQEAPEKQEMNHVSKAGGGMYATSSFDSTDYQAQRAKMKEIATQRAKQLEKEEEERTREQKAKALAKLEELNRRTLAENATQKSESSLQHEESHNIVPQTNTSVPDEVTGVSCSHSDVVTKIEQSMSKPIEAVDHSTQGTVSAVSISVVPLNEEANAMESVSEQISSRVRDNSVFKQKQMGHKRKQHNSREKNLGDKTTATGETRVHGNAIANPSATNAESGSGNNISSNDNFPLQLKKNKSTKNKQKMDEGLIPLPAPFMELVEGATPKAFNENVKPKPWEPVSLEGSSVQPQSGNEIVESQSPRDLVSADKGWLQPSDEPHGRINDKLKPQHPRRISRSMQAFRPAEKLHGTEGAVWAPVRLPPNKIESSEVADPNNSTDSGHSLGKNGYGTQNSLKGKRADIERYVPKPVAKELSQQNSQNPPTPSAHATSEEAMLKADHGSEGSKGGGQRDSLAVEKTDFAVENKNGNNNHNKQGRNHASWRQRGSDEPSMALRSSHKESVAVPVVVTEHGVAGRGRRHLPKVHRVTGQSHFPRNNRNLGAEVTNKADSWAPALYSSEADESSLRIENQGDERMSSHWQPKSQALSSHLQEEQAGSGGQNVKIQVSRTAEKEFSSLQKTHVQLQAEKKNSDQIQPQLNQHKAQNLAVTLVNKSERKGIDTFKEHNKIPYRGPLGIIEVAPENIDNHHEQQLVSPEQRRQGPRNGRFNKQQAASYGGVQGGSQGQEVDNKPHLPTIGDRKKHNSHYEYQPVGSYNNKISDAPRLNPHVDAAPQDGARAVGLRYREKGQNHSRRGGHYGRNGGSAPQGSPYGNGE